MKDEKHDVYSLLCLNRTTGLEFNTWIIIA